MWCMKYDHHFRTFRTFKKYLYSSLCFLCMLVICAMAKEETEHSFDVSFYRLNLDVDPGEKHLQGAVVIEGWSRTTSLDRLNIDLMKNMAVDSVLQNGKQLSFDRSSQQIDIQLENPLKINEKFSIEIFYQGSPRRFDMGAFVWSSNMGVPRIWTLSEPYGAPAWWPCKDDPADKVDSVFMNITVPDSLVAASNGLLTNVSESEDGRKTYSWETRYPISNYLVVLTVANYVEFSDWFIAADGDSMLLQYFVYPEYEEEARDDFAITKSMMSAFTGYFGRYPFFEEKYGIASVGNGAAMEHQTLTTLPTRHITGYSSGDYILAHELGHHWFGDCITMREWSHVWLNEGFATYSEALWEEHSRGKAAYHRYMNNKDPGYFSGTLYISNNGDFRSLFSRTVYSKGAWVVHMLRGVMGDAHFFQAVRNYLNDPQLKYGNAITEDLQKHCESVYGADLGWFFQQWIYQSGRPDYEYRWQTAGTADGFLTTLDLYQLTKVNGDSRQPFKMPLDVHLSGVDLDTMITIWDSLSVQKFEFVTGKRPRKLTIDPDDWVLKEIREIKYNDISRIPETLKLEQNSPNPFDSSTIIRYGIPAPGSIKIEIFDTGGTLVFNHRDPAVESGFHQFIWDGLNNYGEMVPSGIYFYQISHELSSLSRKMLLVR